MEHATFLGTGLLFWRVVLSARGAGRVSSGFGVLLSVLLTFAREPWYSTYAETTAPWGLDPLADQQLAGAIMWVPAGRVYLVVGLTLLVTWVQAMEAD